MPTMFEKFSKLVSQKTVKEEEDDRDEESLLVEVILNAEKHPSPELPPMPEGLSQLQVYKCHEMPLKTHLQTLFFRLAECDCSRGLQ